eukprot:jgi/Chlat1/6278/Chrsp44S05781
MASVMASSSGLSRCAAAIAVASSATLSGLPPQRCSLAPRVATSVGASVCSTSGRPLLTALPPRSATTCRHSTSMSMTPPPPASRPGRAATKKALAAVDVGGAGGAGGGGGGGGAGGGGARPPSSTQAKAPSSWLQAFASADASVKEVIRPLTIGLKAGLVGALAVDVVHGIKPRLSFLETVEVTIFASLFAAAFVAALSFSDVLEAFQNVMKKGEAQNRVPSLCPAGSVQISVKRGKRKVQQTSVDRVTLTHALQAAGSKGVEQVLWLVGNELKDNETVVAITAEMEGNSYTIAGSTELALAAHACSSLSIDLFRL